MSETAYSLISSTSSSSYSDSTSKESPLESHEIKKFLPKRFNIKNLPRQEVIEKLTVFIEDFIELTFDCQTKNNIFYNSKIPDISIFDYLTRIGKYTSLENSTLVLALIYIDRICGKRDFELNKFNIHKFLFTAIMVAIKYNEDKIYDIKCFSKIGGISGRTLNKLEFHFLELIDYELFVQKEEYKNYCDYFRDD